MTQSTSAQDKIFEKFKSVANEGDMRAAYLDHLYELDERLDPKHELYGLYTGLWQDRREYLMQLDRADAIGDARKTSTFTKNDQTAEELWFRETMKDT